jgi:hypothetical protein
MQMKILHDTNMPSKQEDRHEKIPELSWLHAMLILSGGDVY